MKTAKKDKPHQRPKDKRNYSTVKSFLKIFLDGVSLSEINKGISRYHKKDENSKIENGFDHVGSDPRESCQMSPKDAVCVKVHDGKT